MDPVFLSRDVTDDELAAEVTALQSGRYPRWRLDGEAGYSATEGPTGALEMYNYKRLWLRDAAGHGMVVTLQRLRAPAVWRRIAIPGEN